MDINTPMTDFNAQRAAFDAEAYRKRMAKEIFAIALAVLFLALCGWGTARLFNKCFDENGHIVQGYFGYSCQQN